MGIILLKGSGGGEVLENPLQFKGAISLASEFPTSADVENGWFYRITADVTDNDATKTNTGQSFQSKDEIIWNGTDWTVVGNTKDVDYIQLDTALTPVANQPGLLQWNEVDGTVDIGLKNGSTYQAGQEMYFYGKASGNILNGELCQFAGVQGDHILVKKVVSSEVNSFPEYLVGIATQNINNGDFGYVTWFGKVNEVYTKTPDNNDDADWLAGDLLYFNLTTGQLTKTMPSAPDRQILIASVIKEQTGSAENGILLVRPTFGRKLVDLNDVDGTPLTTSGQILVWDNVNQYFDFTENINDYVKAELVTTVGTPGSDTNVPTEQAVREAISAAGGGDVTGPVSASDNNIVLFDGTSGKLIKDSGITISALSNVVYVGDNVSDLVNDAGYLTAETDPVFAASQAYNIDATDITNLSNLSGTNTGDQTITLTGDVTGSGTDSFAATIANDAVTYAKIQDVTASKLLGRASGTDGVVEEIPLGTGLAFSAGVLNASAAAGSADWGGIGGTLSDQTDLQGVLDDKLDANTPITGATKTKITYDANGLVTAGADATTADIADSTNKRYVTDAQLTVIGNTSGTNTGDQDLSSYALKTNVLELDNTTAFTPDADYEPATKKYVDDELSGLGAGDVTGPASSTTDHIPQFSDTTGKVLKDGLGVVTTVGSPGTDTNVPTEMAVRAAISSSGFGDVSGPASSTDGNIPIFSGTSGKLLSDSGINIADIGGTVEDLPRLNIGNGTDLINVDTTGIFLIAPWDGSITAWKIWTVDGTSKTIEIDILKNGTTIGQNIDLSSASSNSASSLAISFSAGDALSFNVDANTDAKKIIVQLLAEKD